MWEYNKVWRTTCSFQVQSIHYLYGRSSLRVFVVLLLQHVSSCPQNKVLLPRVGAVASYEAPPYLFGRWAYWRNYRVSCQSYHSLLSHSVWEICTCRILTLTLTSFAWLDRYAMFVQCTKSTQSFCHARLYTPIVLLTMLQYLQFLRKYCNAFVLSFHVLVRLAHVYIYHIGIMLHVAVVSQTWAVCVCYAAPLLCALQISHSISY